MHKIKAFIIDDEISALHSLKGMLLEFCPEIEVCGQARNVDEAYLGVLKYKPDLVFLDIEMPPLGSGFDFLAKFKHRKFGTIFTTAYPQYAIKAINEAQPWGYLIKPFSDLDLVQAVQSSLLYLESTKHAGILIPGSTEEQRLIVADQRKGNIVIRLQDIIVCQADGATTDIFYINNDQVERITASKTMKEIEKQLPENVFFRCHHSFIVNFFKIIRYERTGRNGQIYLVGNRTADVSVLRMDHFLDNFKAFLNTKKYSR